MQLELGRDLCADLHVSGAREWLVTNGIGGFACGTVAGVLSRRYHGLLLAALKPPVGRTLLLAKLDETVEYDEHAYALYCDRFDDGAVFPKGFKHLESFRLEGMIPVWSYCFADVLLEKRIWMEQGANVTYVRYTFVRGSAPLALMLTALVNTRAYQAMTHPGSIEFQLGALTRGVKVDGGVPFYLRSDRGACELYGEWLAGYFYSVEQYRGDAALEDHYHAATFNVTLKPGESLTLAASLEPDASLDGAAAYARRVTYENALRLPDADAVANQLARAADQFIVRRALPDDPDGRTVIAGYPWFSDWGRDTMIALPGLTLAAGRTDVATRILRTFAHYVSEGMLPNRFPDAGSAPEYNTADATLWYFEAIRAYLAATGDEALLEALFPTLKDIIAWHHRGTRYQIRADPADGLLYAGEDGVQLTWMDAKVADWVVTPRIGKPVEINALWYNALRAMADFADFLGEPSDEYTQAAERARAGFARFWNAEAGFCCDVLDTPDGGNDTALRPNQLFAVSLHYAGDLLTPEQQRAVVDVCARQLLTSHGLRSLSPDDPQYVGVYGGDLRTRDGAYHQGTVWGWLIGPFAEAHLRVYGDRAAARSFLMGLVRHLRGDCLGTMNEIFDGDTPHLPRGCFAQAWTVAEVLRLWRMTEED